MKTQLSAHLFEGLNLEELIAQLTGEDMSLRIDILLQPLGLPFVQTDLIDNAIYAKHTDQLMAAFLAGYLVGRNPDLLVLQPHEGGPAQG